MDESTGAGESSGVLLTLEAIQALKNRYIHPGEKQRQIIDDLLRFQSALLDIPSHYRKIRGLGAPFTAPDHLEYGVDDPICGEWEYAFIILNLPLQPGLTVLEAASSASILPAYLSHLGYRVISVDLETSYQGNIRRESGIRYGIARCDLAALGIRNESVDVIVSNSALEHVERDEAAWREFTRILKPGGRMIHTFPVATPGAYTNAWFQEPVDFFAHPTPEHDRTHRLVSKSIAEERYLVPNRLRCASWEEAYSHREIQAYVVVMKP
jgi:2-polyprenyl-3-methyl-5-hydroxy-6-metoxy-1,4-benzoquinol methylase